MEKNSVHANKKHCTNSYARNKNEDKFFKKKREMLKP